MVEEALVAAGSAGLRPLRRVPEEAHGGERAIARLRPRHPALLAAVGISGDREPDRGERGDALRRIAIGREAVGGVGRLPEATQGAVRAILYQRLAAYRESRRASGRER